MSLETLPAEFGKGGSNLTDGTLHDIIRELQGIRVDSVVGAAPATPMTLAAIRPEDTLISVINLTDGIDDVANVTIDSVSASETITLSGLPVADETVTVNGVVFTFKATALGNQHVTIGTDQNDTGDNLATSINAYQADRPDLLGVTASSNGAGVVTVTSVEEGVGNGPIVTEVGTTITVDSATDPGAVTATFVSAGNGDSITVNGVTFTVRTTPTDQFLDMPILGTDTLQAAELVRAVNAYQAQVGDLGVSITSAAGVATISADGIRTGNSITLAEAATNLVVGAAFFSGGTATGSIQSSTTHVTDNLLVTWFNKK